MEQGMFRGLGAAAGVFLAVIFGLSVATGFVIREVTLPKPLPIPAKKSKCAIQLQLAGYTKPGLQCEDGTRWLFEDFGAPLGPDRSSKLIQVE